MEYTYSIFDSNPAVSGPCALPEHDGETIEAEDDNDAANQVRDLASAECDDERLWFYVWDADGQIVADGTVEPE